MKKRLICSAAAALITLTSALPVFAAEDKVITDVSLTIEAPQAGAYVSDPPSVKLDSEGIKLNGDDAVSSWTETDYVTVPKKFTAGEEYGVSVAVCPEDGYKFSDNTITLTVNGEKASGSLESDGMVVYATVKAEVKKSATGDSAGSSTKDSATPDSGKNYDNSNNANGSIPTNEGNATVIIFAVVIGIAAVAGVAYFIITKRKK
ncbi:MAG: hypothetical protein UH734_08210 [Ruminococcus sp.]|jgi:hypothetical protein|nr:hypothetical protein [Ruminococcus sp.]